MAQPPLTPNAIVALNAGDTELRPVVQVLDVRQIGTNQNVQERYRLVLSDGSGVQQAMLATQLNEVVKTGRLVKGSIVRLQEYICNTVKDRKIVIVLNMDVLATQAELVGEPKQGMGGDATPSVASNQPYQPPQQTSSANSQYQQPQQLNPPQPASAPTPNVQYPPPQPRQYSAPQPAPVPSPQQYGRGSAVGAQAPVSSAVSSYGQQNPYGRPSPSPYQPSATYTNRGPIARNEGPPGIVPIAALNPYHGRWTVKARITAKSELRRFNNARGDGKVFSFDLLDAEGGEIRVTCFNSVADQFFDRVQVGQVYLVSKGTLKPAAKAFNHLKNDWEITFEKDSILDPCPDDASVPQQVFDFKPISEIENLSNNATVDVIGVVVAVNQTTTIMRKNGTETQRRTLQLRDRSGKSVEVTMWGSFCSREGQQLQELFDSGHCPILAIKAGRISDFSGKTVGTISQTQLQINPDLPDVLPLRQWFEQEGKHVASQSISREGAGGGRMEVRKTVAQIKDEGLGRSEKPDFISVRATIHFIKTDNFCYTACPLQVGERQCNKKVTNNGDGTWRCDRCDQTVPDCDYRYLLSIQVMDHTGSTWLSAFQEAAEEILQVPAKELLQWKQDENGRFLDHITSIQFSQHHFKLKIKEESYNDEQRVKATLLKSEKCDFVAESKYLLEMIGKLQRGESINGPAPAATNTYGGGYSSAIPTQQGLGQSAGSGGGYANSSGVEYARNTYAAGTGGSYGGNMSTGGYGNSGGGGGGGGYVSNSGGYGAGYGSSSGGYGAGAGYNPGGGYGNRSNNGYGGGGGGSGGYNNYNSNSAGGGYGSSGNCYKCGQGGHWARDCPNQGSVRGSYGGGASY